ncbi:MAG: dTDP-glucose 4,6-dehydratase [Bacteroidota bacterium]
MSTPHSPRVVLVTGGAGFIGANFLLRMVPRYPDVQFVNLDALTYAGNPMTLQPIEDAENYTFVHGDIADGALVQRLFDEHDFSTVAHFAAESHVDRSILDPLAFVRTNVVGTATLLDAARRAWTTEGAIDPVAFRFYHISTDEVFGTLGDTGAFDETTPYDPHSPYSASKAGSDHLVRAYADTYGLPVVISNCSNNYGPFQFPEKLIPLMITKARDLAPLPVYGAGENVRDWLHVEDHADAIDLILRDGRNGETYCIGGRAERRNLDVVHTLCDLVDEALGREVGTAREQITFVKDRPGHDFRYAIDAGKLETELGWTRNHTFESGLRATVAWYLANESWLQAVMDQSYRDYVQTQYGERVDA